MLGIGVCVVLAKLAFFQVDIWRPDSSDQVVEQCRETGLLDSVKPYTMDTAIYATPSRRKQCEHNELRFVVSMPELSVLFSELTRICAEQSKLVARFNVLMYTVNHPRG